MHISHQTKTTVPLSGAFEMGDRRSGGFGGGRGGGGGGRGRGGGGGGRFQKSDPDAPRVSSEVQIFVEGLPLQSKIPELVQYFSSVGPIKCDRETKKPRVWLYQDKTTGQVGRNIRYFLLQKKNQISCLGKIEKQNTKT